MIQTSNGDQPCRPSELLSILRQTYHKEVSKMMWGATEEELNELAAIVAQTSFWSNILHTQNYDFNTFVKELQQIGEYMVKNNKKK